MGHSSGYSQESDRPFDTNRCVPFAIPDISDEEISEVVATLRSGWITTGERVEQFQREFSHCVGGAHAIALNSGTAGLHIALAALGIGPGDEVITSPLTFCATVNVILQVGATPVLSDIASDLNLDPENMSQALSPRTKAIIPVHMGGLPCPMDAFWKIAAQRRLFVIEDAAHAMGALYHGMPIGSGQSHAVAFSFYATKNMTTGEGGMVTTPSLEIAERMRILSLHGISRDAWRRYSERGNWYYEVTECGFKYNMSDIMAAMGRVQLRRLALMNARRTEIARRYSAAFAEMPELELPPQRADCHHSWHLYILRLNLDRLTINRGQFFDEMRQLGVGCSVHFIPISLHPYYRNTLELRDPCTKALAEYPRLLSLPIYSKMTNEDVERVIRAVRQIVMRNSLRRSAVSNGFQDRSVAKTCD